jgi:hypothetical protein
VAPTCLDVVYAMYCNLKWRYTGESSLRVVSDCGRKLTVLERVYRINDPTPYVSR